MSDEPTWKTFRDVVRARFEAEIEEEARQAQELKERVVPVVRACVTEARQRGDVRRVILFGSYAWGQPTVDSDIDLLVDGSDSPLAVDIMRRTLKMVHAIALNEAPPGLVERAEREGVSL